MENSIANRKKLKIELAWDPTILLLGTCAKELKAESQRDICTPIIHSSIIHNSQKVEVTQVSINKWMDKQNMLHTYNRLLFNLKKEGNSDTCYNMDEPWEYYANWLLNSRICYPFLLTCLNLFVDTFYRKILISVISLKPYRTSCWNFLHFLQ